MNSKIKKILIINGIISSDIPIYNLKEFIKNLDENIQEQIRCVMSDLDKKIYIDLDEPEQISDIFISDDEWNVLSNICSDIVLPEHSASSTNGSYKVVVIANKQYYEVGFWKEHRGCFQKFNDIVIIKDIDFDKFCKLWDRIDGREYVENTCFNQDDFNMFKELFKRSIFTLSLMISSVKELKDGLCNSKECQG